jgi:hypothetical protein
MKENKKKRSTKNIRLSVVTIKCVQCSKRQVFIVPELCSVKNASEKQKNIKQQCVRMDRGFT